MIGFLKPKEDETQPEVTVKFVEMPDNWETRERKRAEEFEELMKLKKKAEIIKF